jgi:hypothetical protein
VLDDQLKKSRFHNSAIALRNCSISTAPCPEKPFVPWSRELTWHSQLENQFDRSQVTTMELSKGLVQQLMNLLDVMQHMLYQDAVQSFFCVEET